VLYGSVKEWIFSVSVEFCSIIILQRTLALTLAHSEVFLSEPHSEMFSWKYSKLFLSRLCINIAIVRTRAARRAGNDQRACNACVA
jgi:hypothetical protein